MHQPGDERLRADVRLLGDLLGQVLVEQEGQAFLALEERVRHLARDARTGGDRERLEDTVGRLDVHTQAKVLAAFSLFFQLANIAEQHHRVRRRRDYEREGSTARESVAEATARLEEAGVAGEELARAALRLRVEPVLTAHPTEATRRGVLAAHQRIARRLRALDDPWLTPLRQERVLAGLHAEITALWQTDPVRSTRPRVVDEIRTGLWFFETSLWHAVPTVVRALRRAVPSAPAPLRFGSWIGGDMDGNPGAGAETIREAVERSRTLARSLLMQDVRALGAAWGMSSSVTGPIPELDVDGDEPYRAFLTEIWERLRTDGYAAGADLAHDLGRLDAALRAHQGAAIADGELADLRVRVDVFGLHLASLDLRTHVSEVRSQSPRLRDALEEAAAAQQRFGIEAVGRLVVSMTASVEDVLTAERHVAGCGCAPPGRAAARDGRRPARRARPGRGAPRRVAAHRTRGDGRLLRLGEGRWPAHCPVGDLPRAGSARRAHVGTWRGADRVPRPGWERRPWRWADACGHPGSTPWLGRRPPPPHGAGREDLVHLRAARSRRAQPRGVRRGHAADRGPRRRPPGGGRRRGTRSDDRPLGDRRGGVPGARLGGARVSGLLPVVDTGRRARAPRDRVAARDTSRDRRARRDRGAPRHPMGVRVDADALPAARLVRLRQRLRGRVTRVAAAPLPCLALLPHRWSTTSR